MTFKEAVTKGIIEKLNGYGQCSCYICSQRIGFNRHWTSMCYKYNSKIYCSKHISEVFEL